jgi:hypothetical protein
MLVADGVYQSVPDTQDAQLVTRASTCCAGTVLLAAVALEV